MSSSSSYEPKSFSLSRGAEVQKKAVDIMKKESPLFFIWTQILILWCIAGSIVTISIKISPQKTFTPIIILITLPIEVLSFVIVSSKLCIMFFYLSFNL